MHGLMSGDWKRSDGLGTAAPAARCVDSAGPFSATAPAPDSTPPPVAAPLAGSLRAPDMEDVCQGAGGRRLWVNGAGRGRGQDVATVITLIFAGRLRRSRMTVIRHRGGPQTFGRGLAPQRSARGYSAISASPDHDPRCPPTTRFMLRQGPPGGALGPPPRRSQPVRAQWPSAPCAYRCAS